MTAGCEDFLLDHVMPGDTQRRLEKLLLLHEDVIIQWMVYDFPADGIAVNAQAWWDVLLKEGIVEPDTATGQY